jgi:hypothetical protein
MYVIRAFIYTHTHTHTQARISHADLAAISTRREFTLTLAHEGKEVIGHDKQRTTVTLVIERRGPVNATTGQNMTGEAKGQTMHVDIQGVRGAAEEGVKHTEGEESDVVGSKTEHIDQVYIYIYMNIYIYIHTYIHIYIYIYIYISVYKPSVCWFM